MIFVFREVLTLTQTQFGAPLSPIHSFFDSRFRLVSPVETHLKLGSRRCALNGEEEKKKPAFVTLPQLSELL